MGHTTTAVTQGLVEPHTKAALRHPAGVSGRRTTCASALNRRRLLLAIPTLLSLPLHAGCTFMGGDPVPARAPLVVGVAYDITASTHALPVLTAQQLDQLIGIVKIRGGLLAFGLIADRVDEPLTRVEVAPVSGRLDERAQASARNRTAVDEWKRRVGPKIVRARDVQVTDFNGVVRQMDTLFREPTIPRTAMKIAVLITDALHTAKRNPRTPALPDDVTVLAVGIERARGEKLFGERVFFFEDVDSAIKMLRTLADARLKEA